MKHDEYIEQVTEKIAEAAIAMRRGKLSFIEGARQISKLRSEAKFTDLNPDILIFVDIDDQTDALPMGDFRRLSASDTLEKLQPEIDKAEKWAREVGYASCKRLIEKPQYLKN